MDAILLRVMKLFIWEAPLIAVSVFKKLNKDILPHKFLPAKYNLKKVETIAKLARYILKMTVYHNQVNPSTFMVIKI